MPEVRQGPDWHLAYSSNGLYIRGAKGAGSTMIPAAKIPEVVEAILELIGYRHED